MVGTKVQPSEKYVSRIRGEHFRETQARSSDHEGKAERRFEIERKSNVPINETDYIPSGTIDTGSYEIEM